MSADSEMSIRCSTRDEQECHHGAHWPQINVFESIFTQEIMLTKVVFFVLQVKIGYLEFEVGDLQFAKRDPNILLAQILGPIMGLCLAMLLIVIACWMKINRWGPWRKRVLTEPHVRYHAGEIVQISTDQEGTAIYRMNNNHNQNRESNFYFSKFVSETGADPGFPRWGTLTRKVGAPARSSQGGYPCQGVPLPGGYPCTRGRGYPCQEVLHLGTPHQTLPGG